MNAYKTLKQKQYYDDVMRLHFELGYSEVRISNILPVCQTTIHRWIANFTAENKGELAMKQKKTSASGLSMDIKSIDMKELDSLPIEEQVKQLKAALFTAEMRADLNEEIIKVAEEKFKIPIRKKAGAKQ